MTTHDHHAEVTEMTADDRPMAQTEMMKPLGGQPDDNASAVDDTLFDDDELTRLRSQWDSVQAGFVDNPKDCVAQADGLVSELIEYLTTGFAEARSRLEGQWARGETASTEDLRVALRQYRVFFDRLLSV